MSRTGAEGPDEQLLARHGSWSRRRRPPETRELTAPNISIGDTSLFSHVSSALAVPWQPSRTAGHAECPAASGTFLPRCNRAVAVRSFSSDVGDLIPTARTVSGHFHRAFDPYQGGSGDPDRRTDYRNERSLPRSVHSPRPTGQPGPSQAALRQLHRRRMDRSGQGSVHGEREPGQRPTLLRGGPLHRRRRRAGARRRPCRQGRVG